MSGPATTKVGVVLDVGGAAVPAGTAYFTQRRGVVSSVIDYDPPYQASISAYPISPDLPLVSSRHHVNGLPGAFADSAPDRWGRELIRKRWRATQREQPTQREIGEVDYLLGVSDVTRQGALRFRRDDDAPFLGEGAGVPPLVELPALLVAADRVAADRDDDLAAVKRLLDAGTGSLGGARPKASVRDGDRLLIAKFPHPQDEWDVMAWEAVCLELAERAGIGVPGHRLVDVGGSRVLLLERFDRRGAARIGYLSAMSLLGVSEGQPADYLEIAEAIAEQSSNVREHLAQLWRRIVFLVLVNNTDDHLRNHGFLRGRSGWDLSPAFDINPDPDPGHGRATSIGFANDAEACHEALFDTARDFRLTPADAGQVVDEVRGVVRTWRETARRLGIAERELDRFAPVLDRFG